MATSTGFLRLRQPRELLASSPSPEPTPQLWQSVIRDSAATTTSTSTPSCVMWIHLQTPISTEWQHSSMVERPQTIHRCILQRQQQQSQVPLTITCHVCGYDYETYQGYLQHLFDASCCVQQKTKTTEQQPKKKVSHLHRWTSLCPHFAAATQSQTISLDEFLYDEATMATLKVELASLLAGLLGEGRLTALGYPDKDILSILKSLLQMTQSLENHEDNCGSSCNRLEFVLNPTQVKYQKLKCQLAVARLNTMRLLEICLPDQKLWREKKWTEKPVEVVLAEIIKEANSSSNKLIILD